MKNNRKQYRALILLVIAGILSFAGSVKLHPEKDMMTWKGGIWADRAGYYIYLPLLFSYHFDAANAPEKIDEKTGYGFIIDYQTKKIRTKYTYGVAALNAPFYLVAKLIYSLSGGSPEGDFAPLFHRATELAAVFYLILGLWMLNLFLRKYFKRSIRFLLIAGIYLGTNLFYYTVIDGLMSHVYSFFLVSGFLLFMQEYHSEKKYSSFFLMSLFLALIALTRPTNIVLVLLFFFWDLTSAKELRERIILFFKPQNVLSLIALVFLIFIPQLLYWKYLSGKFIFYSYEGESFSYWKDPQLLPVWFSTLNGLFTYTPLFFLIIAGIITMIIKRVPNGILIMIVFLFTSYLFSSWYNWYYGCSFGQRSFIEFYPVFAVALGFLLQEAFGKWHPLIKIFLVVILALSVWFNIRMTFAFEKCFFGSVWDWNRYRELLHKAHLFRKSNILIIKNDYENNAINGGNYISDSVSHSGKYSLHADSTHKFCCGLEKHIWEIGYFPRKAVLSAWILSGGSGKTNALIVCSIERDGKSLFWFSHYLDPKIKPGQWSQALAYFDIPDGLLQADMIRFYIWNRRGGEFFTDDIKIIFER